MSKLQKSPEEEPTGSKAPAKFGEEVTSDSIIVLQTTDRSRHGDTTSMTIRDRGSGWTDGYPAPSKSTANVREAVQDFKGSGKIDHLYSDGASEIHAACREEGIRHDKSDPNRHETNGAIERTNRTVIEGTHMAGVRH